MGKVEFKYFSSPVLALTCVLSFCTLTYSEIMEDVNAAMTLLEK